MDFITTFFFILSLVVMFSSITSSWILYLRFKKKWIKKYITYALVWTAVVIQSVLYFFIDNFNTTEAWGPVPIFIFIGLSIALFLFENMALPLLLFHISGIKAGKWMKFLIPANPVISLLLLVTITLFAAAIVPNAPIDKILRFSIPILITFTILISLLFQVLAFRIILRNKSTEISLLIFIFLTMGYQLLIGFTSAEPLPGRIPLGSTAYNLVTYIYSIIVYMVFFVFNILKLSKEFSGLGRVISSVAVKEFGLTEREEEISNLILKGMSSREISEKLFISKKTADTHIYNIYKKCGVTSKVSFFNQVC